MLRGVIDMFPSFTNMLFNTIVVLLLIVFFLVSYDKILNSIIISFSTLFNIRGGASLDKTTNNFRERINSLLFLLFLLGFIITNKLIVNGIEPESPPYNSFMFFSVLILSCIAYFGIKTLIIKVLSWVNGDDIFLKVNNLFFIYSVLFIVPIIIFFIINLLFPQIPIIWLVYVSLSIILLIYLIYIIRGYQMIISNGFSQFFYILYLCTLELFPLIFFVHFIFD